VLLRGGFLPKLRGRIAGDADLAAEPGLGFPEGRREVCESYVPDHQQVDVARSMLLAARDRPVDERAGDPSGEWTEDCLERRHHAGGLVDETAQLGKDRRSRVRLEVGAGALSAGLEDAPIDQRFELALSGSPRGRHPEP
jgi:hypothetical protein